MRSMRRAWLASFCVLSCSGDGEGMTEPPAPPPDTTAPLLIFASPVAGTVTTGQSGVTIVVAFTDNASGVDTATLQLTSSRRLGGVFRRNGTTTVIAAGTDLTPLFETVTATDGRLIIPDSLAMEPGPTVLTARISDRSGNLATATVELTVSADPDALILADARGAAGQVLPWVIGLRNNQSIGGLQFDVILDPAVVASVDSVHAIDRAVAATGGGFNVANSRLRIVVFDAQGSAIGPGESGVLRVFLTLRQGAPAGAYGVSPVAVRFASGTGETRAAQGSAAIITIQ